MNSRHLWGAVLAATLALPGRPAWADRPLGVEVWTDRGDDAVYEPGDRLEVKVRASDDSYLLVYEIDAEGDINLLYPYRGSGGMVEGRRTYIVPPENARVDLVVQAPVGQCFVVAIASREPFRDLPWYLRPYDMQAQDVGYRGEPDEEEGVTAEGRIVGDPYVAMERVRRRVLVDAEDPDLFTSSYTTYYVHHEVRYPRYLCYDCHRPGHWAWWNGFDPYYTSCSTFDFRVNWGWSWGPSYWFGSVPYYYYVYRDNCPPHYRRYYLSHVCYSAWDGWRRWCSSWGGPLVRRKTAPPPNYVPPDRYRDRAGAPPPGLIGSNLTKGGRSVPMPIGRRNRVDDAGGGDGGTVRRGEIWKPLPGNRPGREIAPGGDGDGSGSRNAPRTYRPSPADRPGRELAPRRNDDRSGSRNAPRNYRPSPADRPGRELAPRRNDDGSGSQNAPRNYRPSPSERPREESRPPQFRPERESPPPRAPREERPKEERPREERPREARTAERPHESSRPELVPRLGVPHGERSRGSR